MIEERAERLRNRWGRRHPRLTAAAYAVTAVIGVLYAVGGVAIVAAHDDATPGLIASIGFFGLSAVVTGRAAVRHVQIARDPSADDARLQAILDQPRDQLVRKARWSIWALSAALVVVGAVMALTARPVGSHVVQLGAGGVLAVLGVGLAARGEKRLRDPDVYL